MRPFILRRMTTAPALVPDLPDKTEIPAYCPLTPEQAALYQTQIDTPVSYTHLAFCGCGGEPWRGWLCD